MDENAIHQWLIDCFGQVQGDMAWNQLQAMPAPIRDQIFGQDPSKLPKPSQMQAMMQAVTSSGLGNFADLKKSAEEGPVNVKLAESLAHGQAGDESSERTVNAVDGQAVREAMSAANLWLDSACGIDPAPGEAKVLTRINWVDDTLDSWADFAAPVSKSYSDALSSVLSERFGDAEISEIFAGPVPIALPEGMNDPASIIRFMGNTAFSMQLGTAAGNLSHEVHGSFDQGIALSHNAAGGLVAQNCIDYAKELEMDRTEVLDYLALEEVAHARLYANVPWLMPRFKALIGKYARGVNIDLDAIEEQLRDATSIDPESLSGSVDMTKVAIADTPEQKEALHALEELLALVEGWVDTVTWQAGMAHIPHIEQLREMARRERAVGGPAERTFASLIGLKLKPKRMREAAQIWERIGQSEGTDARDAKWGHPDLLPKLPDLETTGSTNADATDTNGDTAALAQAGETDDNGNGQTNTAKDHAGTSIDWDAELDKLLAAEQGHDGDQSDQDNHGETDDSADTDDSGDDSAQ